VLNKHPALFKEEIDLQRMPAEELAAPAPRTLPDDFKIGLSSKEIERQIKAGIRKQRAKARKAGKKAA
jgi:hypothetical protein